MAARNDKILDAALLLRGENPQLWENFVDAVREHAAQLTADMLAVDPGELPRRQGMAIALSQFHLLLRDAPTLHQERQVSWQKNFK